MTVADIDLWELNEAFAAVVLRYMQALDIPHDKMNVNGGGIAMGHPLGATGAMIIGIALDELERSGQVDRPDHPVHRRRHGHRHRHRTRLRDHDHGKLQDRRRRRRHRPGHLRRARPVDEHPDRQASWPSCPSWSNGSRPTTPSRARSSPRARPRGFCAGADLGDMAGGMLAGRRRPAGRVRRRLEDERRAARAGDLRQAGGGGHQRPGAGRRAGADPGLPLPRGRRRPQDPAGPARDQGRPVPRRRRHPAPAAPDRRAGGDDGDERRASPGVRTTPRARAWSTRSCADGHRGRGRQGLDQGRRQGRPALGRQGLQTARRRPLSPGRHPELPGRQRHGAQAVLRQLSGRDEPDEGRL